MRFLCIIVAKNKKIYFVENFHGIQYFLSVVEPTEKNLIITSGNPHLEKFLDDILPGQERMIIPRTPCYRFFVLPFLLFFWRLKYSAILAQKHPCDAYFFGKGVNIHYFAVFNSLQKSGCTLHFIDGSGGKFSEKLIIENSFLQKAYNKVLSLCCGQKLARYKCWAWNHFGLCEFPEPEQINLLDWKAIANKFDFSTEKANNAVLLVDGPIQEIPGVDIQKTQANIVKYFTENIRKEIHLKMHINYDYNSLTGTGLEKKVTLVPRHIPAELIMLRYDEIYFFSSAACYGNNDKKLYSLSKLLIFESAATKTSYWSLFSDYYASNSDVIMVENQHA